MRIPTVTLKQKSTGKIKVVNQSDYATDLGKSRFAGWSLLSETNNDAPEAVVEVAVEEIEEASEEEVIEDAASDEPEEDPIDDDEEDEGRYTI